MAERIPQKTTIRVPLQAYLASDHVSAATGKTIAITISKNGGAYGNPSGGDTNATEIANGSYYVDLSTTDTGTLGPLFVRGTEAATDTIIAIYNVVKATNGGFTALPDTAVTTNASLLTSGTGTDQLSVSSGLVALTGDLTSTMKSSVATAVLTTQMTESYAALHTAPTLAQAVFETRALLAENSVSGTTVTVKKIDGSTTAETFTINSATAPTSITRAT